MTPIAHTLSCRTVRDEKVKLMLFGDCYATEAELRRGLVSAVRQDWQALTYWPGSYVAVVEWGRRQAVVADVAGTRGVYFAFHDGLVQWSLSARALARRTGAAPDLGALLEKLVCPLVPEVTGTATAYSGIHRLPGGHALVIDDDQARLVPYESEDAVPTGFSAASEALRQALSTAVTRRVEGAERVSADFSGGLDSTSLALLAARVSERPVFAVTADDPASPSDDLEYATRAATVDPNILHNVVTMRGRFFDDMDQAPATDQPFSDAARWAMRHSCHEAVIDYGSTVHLTGSGGDTLLTASPYYLANLVRPSRLGALLSHSLARARLRHLPVRSVVASAVRLSRTSYSRALRQLAYAVARPEQAWRRPTASHLLTWYGFAGCAAWITSSVRDQLADKITDAASATEVDGPAALARHRAWCELREFGAYQAELTMQLRAGGLPAHAPFLDNGVVRACMSISVDQRMHPERQKLLLGTALAGLVPAFVLERRTKGSYDGNAYAGLRGNAAKLRDLVADSRLAEAGLIDRRQVMTDLNRMIAGAPGRLAALEQLITTELWLATQESA